MLTVFLLKKSTCMWTPKFTPRLFKGRLYFAIEIKYGKLPFEVKLTTVNTMTGENTKLHLSASYIFGYNTFKIFSQVAR